MDYLFQSVGRKRADYHVNVIVHDDICEQFVSLRIKLFERVHHEIAVLRQKSWLSRGKAPGDEVGGLEAAPVWKVSPIAVLVGHDGAGDCELGHQLEATADRWLSLAEHLNTKYFENIPRVGRASVCHEGAERRLRDEHLKQPSCTRDEG